MGNPLQSYGVCHLPYQITPAMVPPDITWFTFPRGMEGWVDLGVGCVPRWFTCPISNHL